MDELPAAHETAGQDADAPLARDRFARELGDAWEREEPGIYRFVGVDGDAFELHASQKPAVGTVNDD
jgi:hypothetical protein